MSDQSQTTELPQTKRLLLDAGIALMRQKGYNATTVDDICAAAKVTKGAFFHYFKSKEEIAKLAIERFGFGKDQELHGAAYRKLVDPLDRVYGRLEFLKDSVGGPSRLTKGCLIGMLAQELSFTNPELRGICAAMFTRMANDFAKDLAEAKAAYAPNAAFDPAKQAVFFVSLFQGSSLLAKASESNVILMDNIEQFSQHLQSILGKPRGLRRTQSVEVLDLAV